MGRISIAGMLGFVAVFAIGLGMVCRPTTIGVGLLFTLLMGILFSSLLGAILMRGRRGPWVGFALFGWGFLVLGYFPNPGENFRILPTALADLVFLAANSAPVAPGAIPPAPNPAMMSEAELTRTMTAFLAGPPPSDASVTFFAESAVHAARKQSSEVMGFWLMTLAFAGIGSLLGKFLARSSIDGVSPTPAVRHDTEGNSTTVPHVP